ncbi:MAG: metallophosphoesterase [Clostridia bacterium]|nr:metallophosphoesterase [Clostridia bacterium]
MKKLFSLLLCAALLLTAAVPAGAEDRSDADGFKAFVATDIHHFVTDEVPKVDGEYVYFNNLGLTPTLAPALLAEFLRQAAESDADYVFLTGDLADTPDVAQAKAVAKVLARFEKRSGKQVFVINGNHDTNYTGDTSSAAMTVKRFKKIYARFGYDEALCIDRRTCSYTADLKNGYRLIAIDALDRPGNGGGTITPALADWITAQADQAKKDGKQLVALMHHPLMNHFTQMSRLLPLFVISNSEEACRLFAQCGIQLVFTGHFHQNDAAVYHGARDVYDVETTSLSCYPNAYRTAEFHTDAVDIRTVMIETIDTSALPAGYTEAQKARIAADLPGYASDCLKSDSVAKVKSYLNAEKIAGRLGTTNPLVIKLIGKAISAVSDGFDLPLYGENGSIEAFAKPFGLTLPQTEYATLNDAAAAFIAAQLAGDENFDSGSPLVRVLLFGAIAMLCRQAAKPLEGQSSVITQRLRQLVVWAGSLLGRLQTHRWLTDLLLLPLDPLLVGLTVDRAPEDNNIELSFSQSKS